MDAKGVGRWVLVGLGLAGFLGVLELESGSSSGAPRGMVVLSEPGLARGAQPSKEDVATLGRGSRRFATALYGALRARQGNLFFSPLSIRRVLGMVHAGAVGPTQEEVRRGAAFALPNEVLNTVLGGSVQRMLGAREQAGKAGRSGAEPPTLSVVDAVVVREGLGLRSSFAETLGQQFGAFALAADFAHDPEAQREALNDWIAGRTAGRIADLLPSGSIGRSTQLVLVNALYFKGLFRARFDPALTRPDTFHSPHGKVEVDMMHQMVGYFGRGRGYVATELRYQGCNLRLLLILPDEGQFAAFEEGLTASRLQEVMRSVKRDQADLALPKFRVHASVDLRVPLGALGITRAFGDAADFSNLAEDAKAMKIDAAVHEAFVEVNERGTEAAAATAAAFGIESSGPSVYLNRPFVFVIYDRKAGQVLFMGRLTSPAG